MRSMLKMAVSLFTTFAVANLMAQCGPGGCGYQGGYSNQGYGGYSSPAYQGGYQGGYSDHYDVGGGYGYNQGYPVHGGYQDHGYYQDHSRFGGGYQDHSHMGGGYDQGMMYQDHGTGQPGMPQGQHYHDGVYGYDHPMQDHPVQDASGQHIKYYGKPGPDYNAQGAQQSALQPQSAAPGNTSYNYSASSYEWDRLADAGSTTNPNATGSRPNQPTPPPSGTPAGSKSGSSSTSKW